MSSTLTTRGYRMTALNEAAEEQTARLSGDPPESVKDGGYLWETETRLLMGQVDGAEALELEALIARYPAADCV